MLVGGARGEEVGFVEVEGQTGRTFKVVENMLDLTKRVGAEVGGARSRVIREHLSLKIINLFEVVHQHIHQENEKKGG